MNLVILTHDDCVRENIYEIQDDRADHIRSVLRAAIGDIIRVGLLNGPVGQARIDDIEDRKVRLTCGSMIESPLPLIEVDIICALPRPQTLKKMLSTVAMMNVRRLYLIRANRVEKSFFHSTLLEPANHIRFLLEGLSQGRNTRLPIISVHDRFRQFFEDELEPSSEGTVDDVRLLPGIDAQRTILDELPRSCRSIVLAIGPEGGWVPFEEEMMTSLGFRRCRLGPWTLRVEHAVTAALAQIELVLSGR